MIDMRLYLSVFLMMILLSSCDDGEIIVTTFDFEEDTFKLCSDERKKVLYHINNDEVLFETLSLELTSNNFSNKEGELLITDQPLEISLSGSNRVVYRTFDGPVPDGTNAYFCSDIPPSSPRVLQEYVSVGGVIRITTIPVYNVTNNILDHDADGIPSEDEGWNNGTNSQDTDGDGIPDYLDRDDDGDNVLTINETTANPEDPAVNGYLDTDEDGVPDYLDTDDDGDGVPTRLEVTAEAPNDPRNIANRNDANTFYLYQDRFSAVAYTGEINDLEEENTIPVRFQSTVEAQNLKLRNQGGDNEEISFTSIILGNFLSNEIPLQVEPDDEE